jgi:hypothetical protein
MTGELHTVIVRAGMAALRKLPREEQIKLVGFDFSNLDNCIEWVEQNPTFRSEEDERAMDIIRRAAKKLE